MKAILIDDEQLALDFLERQLNKISTVTIVGTYTNPKVGLEYIMNHDVDVVFLDVDMPEISGLELAERILSEKPAITVVFITAYNEYAVAAFDLNALDYIVKPIELSRLQKTVKRIVQKKSQHNNDTKPKRVFVNVSQQLLMGYQPTKLRAVSWRTLKALELFLYLLQNQNHLVRKSVLAELLWPDLTTDNSYSQLYTAIYHVRNVLRDFNDHFQIKSTAEGYILYLTNVVVDIQEWEKSIQSLPNLTVDSVRIYEEMMTLNQRPYLEEYDYLWAENERYRLEQLWLKISFKIAKHYFERNLLEQAKNWYIKICERHKTEEEAHFFLMII